MPRHYGSPNPIRRTASTDAFRCAHCGTTVPGEAPGTQQRNHCQRCLRSLHLDITVGDRRSLCEGIMDPISLWVRQGDEVALLHRCRRCGLIRSNRIAGDDEVEPLRQLLRPLAAVLPKAPAEEKSPETTG